MKKSRNTRAQIPVRLQILRFDSPEKVISYLERLCGILMVSEGTGVLVVEFPLPSQVRSSYPFSNNFCKIVSTIFPSVWFVSDNVNEPLPVAQERVFRTGVKIRFLRETSPRWWAFILWTLGLISFEVKAILVILRRLKEVDVVIFFMMPPYVDLPLLMASKLAGKLTIKVPLGPAPKDQIEMPILYALSESMGLSLVDYFVPEYDSNVAKLREYGQLKDEEKLLPAAHFFILEESFAPTRTIEERRRLVGYIGGFRKVKGILNFVEAAKSIVENDKRTEVLIAGEGALRDEIQQALRSVHGDRLTLSGWIPHSSLPEILNQLRLLVVPSYSEGVPNIIIEAMACGTPVLSTRVGIVTQLIDDGRNGFIIDTNDPAHLADRIRSIVESSDSLLQEVGDRASNEIRNLYTLKATVARWQDIVSEVERRENCRS